MSLPSPIPDNPQKWDGWRSFNSDNHYHRLCLDFDANPTTEQIEENCRQLLVWWQKKLPLKNQPSNPIAQLLRAGLDEAPQYLAEARTKLLDPVARAEIDRVVRDQIITEAKGEFKKILPFAISKNQLTADSEDRLYEGGLRLGLTREEMLEIVEAELVRVGAVRVAPVPEAPPPPPPEPKSQDGSASNERGDAAFEFRRVLKLSRLCLDGDDMTDDQRDAFCNMGESLGLTGGEAEDIIDEYLEEMANLPMTPTPARASPSTARMAAHKPPGRAVAPVAAIPAARPAAAAASKPAPAKPSTPVREPVIASPAAPEINVSPMARLQERQKYPNFTNALGVEMLLVTSGNLVMGSDAKDAAPHEQPASPTTVSCFFIGRFPITNAQYEAFDPAHRMRRAPWADDNHPVIFVSSKDAINFCQWLSAKEGKKYRLPTEAEWEYAARGTDGRIFPWGERLDSGQYANFADRRTNFAWSDPHIDDGFAETAPVGSYPRSASPFGVEDLSGNVFEWCQDYFDFYKGHARVNPQGPKTGTKRICRGGSWRSRMNSLRASARAFNPPDYSANDLGFRIVCDCE